MLFLYNLETKCVNIAMIYVLYAYKLKTLAMKQSSSSLFYCTIGALTCFSNNIINSRDNDLW